MPERRGTYFAFQGLFMAVLLLIFLYHYRGDEGWIRRFALIVAVLVFSLGLIRSVSAETLSRGVFQTALFVGDAGDVTETVFHAQIQAGRHHAMAHGPGLLPGAKQAHRNAGAEDGGDQGRLLGDKQLAGVQVHHREIRIEDILYLRHRYTAAAIRSIRSPMPSRVSECPVNR